MEQEIINTLNEFSNTAIDKDWGDGEWTKRIKDKIAKIGKGHRYWVYASQCDNSDGGEWLFDLTWLNYSGKDLLEVELVLESEWDINGINDDFQKLLLARSNLRVLVFQAKNFEHFDHLVKDLIRQINRFSRSVDGDRYLFSCWLYDTEKKFVHRIHQHQSIQNT